MRQTASRFQKLKSSWSEEKLTQLDQRLLGLLEEYVVAFDKSPLFDPGDVRYSISRHISEAAHRIYRKEIDQLRRRSQLPVPSVPKDSGMSDYLLLRQAYESARALHQENTSPNLLSAPPPIPTLWTRLFGWFVRKFSKKI